MDATGQLVTESGDPVLSNTGQPFYFGPADTRIAIAGDGTVSTENGTLGRLKVVTFDDELALQQAGGVLFNVSNNNPPKEVAFPSVMQGALESSNVQPILELTKMIEVQRSYDNTRSFIDKEDERQKKMIEEMSKQA